MEGSRGSLTFLDTNLVQTPVLAILCLMAQTRRGPPNMLLGPSSLKPMSDNSECGECALVWHEDMI